MNCKKIEGKTKQNRCQLVWWLCLKLEKDMMRTANIHTGYVYSLDTLILFFDTNRTKIPNPLVFLARKSNT